VIPAARADHAHFTVQYKAFPVPLVTEKGRHLLGAVSFVIQTKSQRHVAEVCRLLPRFKEAVFLELDHNPIPVAKRTYVMDGVVERLFDIVHEVMGRNLVAHLYLAPGAHRIGKDSAITDLEGTDENCMSLESLPAFAAAYPSAGGVVAEELAKAKVKARAAAAAAASEAERAAIEAAALDAAAPRGSKAKGVAQTSACVTDLTSVWPAGLHQYSGKWYWLKKVFTLDEDNDGNVENVGFILKSEGLPDIQIYYRPSSGRQSIVSVPTLRLGDASTIGRLCLNQQVYRKPPPGKGYPMGYAPVAEPELSFIDQIIADLSGAMGGMGLWVIGGGVFILIAGVAGVTAMRGRAKGKKKR